MDCKSCVASVLVAAVIVSKLKVSSAGPLPEGVGRWVKPCGDSAPPPFPGFALPPPAPAPINNQLQTLLVNSKTAVSFCDELSNEIESEVTGSVIETLRTWPALQGFPDAKSSFSPGTKLEDALLVEVERLSKIGVFLEEVLHDSPSYMDKVQQLEDKNVNMLCKMHVILKSLDQEVTSAVSRDIMPSEYRDFVDISKKHERNYLIARDSRQVLVAIIKGLETYMTNNL